MDAKKIALLVGALIIAGITAFMAKSMFEQPVVSPVASAIMPTQVEGPEILVATRTLPVGTIIEPDSFRFQPWPEELIENAYFVKGEMMETAPVVAGPAPAPAGAAPAGAPPAGAPAGATNGAPAPAGAPGAPGAAPTPPPAPVDDAGEVDPSKLAGMVVRVQITAGQPLTKGALVQPGDRGFLAAALGPGMRAISVQVDARTGVSGFIFPGDRVDIVLSQSVTTPGAEGPPLLAAETIVRNVRVLATDQRTVPEDAEGKREVKTFSTVTMEVTPRLAEKIAVAQSIGQITLALRSIADNTAELERAIASGEVKVPEGNDAKAEKRMYAQVATRPVDTGISSVVGGDVSRYQRKTVPQPRAQTGNGGSGGVSSNFNPDGSPKGPIVRVARGNMVTEVVTGKK
jgi:pilus assembly protein CpaB